MKEWKSICNAIQSDGLTKKDDQNIETIPKRTLSQDVVRNNVGSDECPWIRVMVSSGESLADQEEDAGIQFLANDFLTVNKLCSVFLLKLGSF